MPEGEQQLYLFLLSAFSYLATEINVTLSWRTSTLTTSGLLHATDTTTLAFCALQTICLRSYSLTYPLNDEWYISWFTSLGNKKLQHFFPPLLSVLLSPFLFLFVQHSIQDSEN